MLDICDYCGWALDEFDFEICTDCEYDEEEYYFGVAL